ncbi:GNAT family N-acetyltransferase [Burkholderia sola]|uniref:GNAT family N-acetyltransferase n=1 Tax=Burkholderia sola TaxID=2843302 RepID=UPI003B8A7AF8
MFALVAARHGRPVGFAHSLRHRSTTHVGPSCYLQDLSTRDSERGKGVGRALIHKPCTTPRAGIVPNTCTGWQTHATDHTAQRSAPYDTGAA